MYRPKLSTGNIHLGGYMGFLNPSPIIGTVLIILFISLASFFFYAVFQRGEKFKTLISMIIFATVGFQLFHVFEHGLQLGYWTFNPDAKPWLTPWAESGVSGLAYFCDLTGTQLSKVNKCGAELLHLVGNGIYLVGVSAMFIVAKRSNIKDPVFSGNLFFQGFHFLEHCTLTLTLLINGKAWGFSTLFGQLSGSELSTYRVWWHFSINAIATILGILALRRLYLGSRLSVSPDTGARLLAERRLNLAWVIVIGVVVLEGPPLLIANLTGEPASQEPLVRNFLLQDVFDKGEWWQVFDPYVLAAILSVAFFFRRLNRQKVLNPSAN